MLMPKRVKYRKRQKGRMRGVAYRGGSIDFGTYGLQALECGRISNRQIEAARIAMTRHIKRGGKIWLRIFPDNDSRTRSMDIDPHAVCRTLNLHLGDSRMSQRLEDMLSQSYILKQLLGIPFLGIPV